MLSILAQGRCYRLLLYPLGREGLHGPAVKGSPFLNYFKWCFTAHMASVPANSEPRAFLEGKTSTSAEGLPCAYFAFWFPLLWFICNCNLLCFLSFIKTSVFLMKNNSYFHSCYVLSLLVWVYCLLNGNFVCMYSCGGNIQIRNLELKKNLLSNKLHFLYRKVILVDYVGN